MISETASFNLIERAWIPAIRHDGMTVELSLRGVLCDAHEIRCVLGDIPTQAFAVQRLLLAIIRRAIEWDPDDPIEHWSRVWRDGVFPGDDIHRYLDRVADRFDLLSPADPFYQVADLATARGEVKPPDVLIADIPPNEKYFTTRAGSGCDHLTFAEAARWLVHTQAFDTSGIRSADPRDPRGRGGKGYPIGVGWVGMLGGILIEGENLFRTLMLNTVLVRGGERTIEPDDLPAWERTALGPTARPLPIPAGPTDLLTWQSRRIRLHHDGARVVGAVVMQGDPVEPFNRDRVEFHSPWRYSDVQSKKYGEPRYYPRAHDPNRALWRGLEALLSTVPAETAGGHDRFRPPGVMTWVSELLYEDALPIEAVIRPHAFGMEYVSQSAVIRSAVDDRLAVSLALLPPDSGLRPTAEKAVRVTEDVARAVGKLASDLARAAGVESGGDSARAEFLHRVDQPYRRWLAQLAPDSDPIVSFEIWQRQVRTVVDPLARDLIQQAGPAAWRGREVMQRWLDSATAERWYRSALRKSIPDAYPPVTAERDRP